MATLLLVLVCFESNEKEAVGGGGFLICLTKEPNQIEAVKQRIKDISQGSDVAFYKGEISFEGLQVKIGDVNIGNPLVKKTEN